MLMEWTDIHNNKVLKNNPLKITIHAGQSEYADTMTVVYRYDEAFTFYKEVKFVFEDKTVFRGIVDKQILTHKEGKIYLELHCRTLAGYLTDNEVQPQNVNNITDSAIYHSYMEKFGISVHHIANKPYNGIMNIGKNRSIYDLAEKYSQSVFHTAFRVDSDGTAFFDGNSNTTTYVFTDTFTDLSVNTYSYTALCLEYDRKAVISQVNVKSSLAENDYTLAIKNPYAEKQKISSVKYLDATPSGGRCIFDAEKLIQDSNQQAIMITVYCSCFVFNALHGKAVVHYQGEIFDNAEIIQADYCFEKGKVSSILKISCKGV